MGEYGHSWGYIDKSQKVNFRLLKHKGIYLVL